MGALGFRTRCLVYFRYPGAVNELLKPFSLAFVRTPTPPYWSKRELKGILIGI